MNELTQQDNPDAVALWFRVEPTGKGWRDHQQHAFGAGWVAAALALADKGDDPAHIEVPAMCNAVCRLGEMRAEGGGAPCEPCLAVVPLQPVAEPEDCSGPALPAGGSDAED